MEEVQTVEEEVRKISEDDVRKALKRMKNGRTDGPDDIWGKVCHRVSV